MKRHACSEGKWTLLSGVVPGQGLLMPPSAPLALDSDHWLPAVVPGTVLQSLIANGRYLDPYLGLNNLTIPNIGDVGINAYWYWFFG